MKGEKKKITNLEPKHKQHVEVQCATVHKTTHTIIRSVDMQGMSRQQVATKLVFLEQ